MNSILIIMFMVILVWMLTSCTVLSLIRSTSIFFSEDFDQARQQVFEALRKGRFYNSVHAAAHGQGFRFWGKKGQEKISMGSTVSFDSPLTLHIQAPFSFAAEIHLIHNGKSIYSSTEENVSYEVSQPGTYRVEVYLKERSPLQKNIPWIVSNPIFLREDKK